MNCIMLKQYDSVILNGVKFTVLKRDGDFALIQWIESNVIKNRWVCLNNLNRKVA